jgi:acyl-CoA thioester hydrolase
MHKSPPTKTRLAYRVPYADTDQMGVVYYANHFVYFERLRNEMLREAGLPYRELEQMGILLPVGEAHCEYHQPARYDDMLDLVGWAELLSPMRLRANVEIWRDGELLAKGYTIHVSISAQTFKPIRLPKEVQGKLGGTHA